MKKSLQLIVTSMLFATTSFAQWCTPTVTPYAGCPSMPGISNVTFNTINYNSSTCESASSNYVNTGQSTTVTVGTSYAFSMTYNVDASIDPQMNLRVWIDFNIDGQLDDIGETVVSVDYQNPGTYNGTISIPMSATAGTTRMRVTSKMTSNGGHTLPTPCNIPADPFGYHGGVEDYTLIIFVPPSVEDLNSGITGLNISPNPTNQNANLSYTLTADKEVSADLYSISGAKISSLIINQTQIAGDHTTVINTEALEDGIYFVKLMVDGFVKEQKLVVNR